MDSKILGRFRKDSKQSNEECEQNSCEVMRCVLFKSVETKKRSFPLLQKAHLAASLDVAVVANEALAPLSDSSFSIRAS